MSVNSLPPTKPSDFNLKNIFFWDTPFQNSEMELIARNIVVISVENGDSWDAFSFDEYIKRCKHKVTEEERRILNALVRWGALTETEGRYAVTDKFFTALAEFIT